MEKIVLASSSPRRRELMARAGFRFEVIVSEADENIEVEAPEGYLLDQTKRQFSIDQNSFDIKGQPIPILFPMVTNSKGVLGEAVLYKVDADDHSVRLPDAHFYLMKKVDTDAESRLIQYLDKPSRTIDGYTYERSAYPSQFVRISPDGERQVIYKAPHIYPIGGLLYFLFFTLVGLHVFWSLGKGHFKTSYHGKRVDRKDISNYPPNR